MRYANEKIVEKLKKRYPEGCRVELVKMNDKFDQTQTIRKVSGK